MINNLEFKPKTNIKSKNLNKKHHYPNNNTRQLDICLFNSCFIKKSLLNPRNEKGNLFC